MAAHSTAPRWRRALWHLRQGGVGQLREWMQRERLQGALPRVAGRRAGVGFDPMDLPDFVPTERPKAFGQLRVAVIMDEFSLQAWGYEFSTIAVIPGKWQAQISEGIDLLFVESAWNGNSGAWQYQLTGSKAPSTQLQQLVEYCAEREIPTVFWNKEDPPHFEDFLDTAALFDVVFTSDSNMVASYQQRLGHERVFAMSFAAQPAIHNPIRASGDEALGDVAFAGMYFAHKYPERREQLDYLLGGVEDAAHRMDRGLTIYSRFSGGDERYQFPAPYDQRVVGSLPYSQMLSAYRNYKVFLNVNSVVDSPSMCARRVFEITASGTPVVSAPSKAIPEFFPADEVPIAANREEASHLVRGLVNSKQLRDRMVHRAQRRIWGAHTYSHRAQQVVEAAGLNPECAWLRPRRVTAMVSTNRPHQVRHAINQVARQTGVEVQLALLAHGFDVDEREIRAYADDLGLTEVVLLRGRDEWMLGDCLNALVEAADGDFVAKIDDDDLYAPHYLLDQTNALWYSGADLVGKQASYLYLGSQDAVVLRNPEREHCWTTFVAGPTLVAPKETMVQHPFESRNRGEDTAFLRSVGMGGGRIYSSDRFNFMQVRGSVAHTWNVDDSTFLANGVIETYGVNEAHVLVD